MKEIIKKIKDEVKKNRKIVLVLLIGLSGIILLSFSEIKPAPKESKDEAASAQDEYSVQNEYTQKLEEKLTLLLSEIENAGEVKVMINLECSYERVYAINETIKSDDRSNTYSNEYVIIDNKNEKEGVKIKINEPKIQGVAVVCSGGNDPMVVSQITSAVTAVLGIGANRVSVSKMK